jgi:glycosyltransferase involved in cell wall biosynthesis
MRVLHLVSCRGWSSDPYWAARMTVELGRLGHTVTLVCRRGADEVQDAARRLGVERIETLAFPSGWHPAPDARDLARIGRWLDDHDIVHAHRGKEHWLAAVANRVAGRARPLVRTRHIVHPVRAHALNRWLYRRATSAVIAPTEAIRRQLVGGGLVAADRVVTLRGGVDLPRFAAPADGAGARARLGVPPGRALVGVIAGFRFMKAHDVIIEAARRLADAGPPVHVLLAGRGPEEDRIRRAVADAGLRDHVTIAGALDDLPAAMAALDIAVYAPAYSDGMSRVLFEYLAAARPVVAARVGVVTEVLEDGRTALLVPAEDASALAQGIVRLVDDPALAERIGQAGQDLVRSGLSGAHVAGRLASIYAAALPR